MAKAFLQNNEPKSAKVCLQQADLHWADFQKQTQNEKEIQECKQMNQLNSSRVQMELDSAIFAGDIKNLAFLKQPAGQANLQTEQVPASQPQTSAAAKPKVEAHLNPKYDWFQNASHVFITFKVVGNDPELSKKYQIDIQENQVKLTLKDNVITVPLS